MWNYTTTSSVRSVGEGVLEAQSGDFLSRLTAHSVEREGANNPCLPSIVQSAATLLRHLKHVAVALSLAAANDASIKLT